MTSEQDLQRFATMLNLVEAARRMPASAKPCMVTMLPKARGGHRPIALFRALFRAWGKVRNPLLAQWALHLQTQVFTMSPTRRITDILYREMCRSLIKQTQHTHTSSRFTATSANTSITSGGSLSLKLQASPATLSHFCKSLWTPMLHHDESS
jgi:hypothetical protein